MIISNNGVYQRMKSPMDESTDTKKEENKEESHEVETTNVSSDSMVDIAKMISSMLSSTEKSSDIQALYSLFHNLDKRISVCEALIKHMSSK